MLIFTAVSSKIGPLTSESACIAVHCVAPYGLNYNIYEQPVFLVLLVILLVISYSKKAQKTYKIEIIRIRLIIVHKKLSKESKIKI